MSESPNGSVIGFETLMVERALGGVDMLGFFTAEHGVGQAARDLVETMRAGGVNVNTINYMDTESRTTHEFETEERSEHRVLFLALNPDHINAAVRALPEQFFSDRYVISQWFWELETPAPWFREAFSHVNELWAPTRFIEQMLRNCVPEHLKVVYMPPSVSTPEIDTSLSRQWFGLDSRFMFLFSFDFMSIAKRKNPWGLVQAFKSAFSEGEGPQLVIKCINGDKRKPDFDRLLSEIDGHSDIVVLPRYLTRSEASTLTSLADCYVSLHRSEGLGLTITEAISLGVPTIATAYSGNLDFMDAWDTWRVPSTLVRVGHGAGGYDSRAIWAKPDLTVAARMMREIWSDPVAARERATLARDRLLNDFSMETSGARMKSRLEAVWAALSRG